MVILITGASSGIGRHLVLHYLKQGHTVAAISRREQKLQELYQAPECQHGQLKIYPADVTHKSKMAAIIQAVKQDLGALDIVIANAGIATQQLTANLQIDAFDRLMQTNLMGVFYTLIPAANVMMQQGHGQLVCISSLAAFHAIPRMSTYCASKAALNYQLAGLYWILKPHGIDVTTICPGFIKSAMTIEQQVPMYWCLEPDTAIKKIAKAIQQRQRLYCFPFLQYQLLKGFNLLPYVLQGFVFDHVIERVFPRPTFSKA